MIKLEPAESSELEEFLDELPTRRCGEGGCDECDRAFHASCDTMYLTITEPTEAGGSEWDGDTLPVLPLYDDIYMELGGEG